MSDMTAAVIVAAGRSKRMGRTGDKVWMRIAGRPVLFYSLAAFELASVREIVVVARPDRVESMKRRLARYPASGRTAIRVVAGGRERQDSVWNGISAVAADIVLVHDAARPAVTPSLIRAVERAARRHGACVPALPVADTLKQVSDGMVVRTENRSGLFGVQTPQGFRRDILRRAIAHARQRGSIGTDCSALVESTGHKVVVVAGDPRNLKLTRPPDAILLKAILTGT